MKHHWSPPLRTSTAGALLAVFAACGGTAAAPQPGQMRGTPPDLRGRRVIVLPVQIVSGVAGDPDAELSFALNELGRDISWIEEDELADALARSPGVDTRVRGLPVSTFLQAEVRRIGDPLFGHLRRMAALVDADAVLLPVAATYETNKDVVGSAPRVRLTTALIAPRTGQVLWFGVEEGGEFPREDPRGLASAMDRVARTLLWYAG